MANSWQQTIKDWTIRRKILTGFAMVLALTTALGWQAIRTLDRLNAAGTDVRAAEQIFHDSRMTILVFMVVTIAHRRAPRSRPGSADRGSAHRAGRSGGAGLQGRPDHRYPEPVARRDRLAGALHAADGEESAGDRDPDRRLFPHRRHVGRRDLRLVDPDGQGRGDAVELDRGDVVHDGRDRLPDAAPGPERRGARRQRGPDLGLDPGDERHARRRRRRTARSCSARSRRPRARSAP